MNDQTRKYAVWAITPQGAHLAHQIASGLPDAALHFSVKVADVYCPDFTFERLSDAVADQFSRYTGHVFIMSAGIVVRMIAGHIRHKTRDPAVVVVDEKGRHAISLLSGHLGGANDLAQTVSAITGADPVITTATDVNDLPAIDLFAQKQGMVIENPEAIKYIDMAILTETPIYLHDPYNFLDIRYGDLSAVQWKPWQTRATSGDDAPGVYIDDRQAALPSQVLILRPPTLAAGIGCKRGTGVEEIENLLFTVLARNGLAPGSLKAIASVDLKQDEAGLLELARRLSRPLTFYSRNQLSRLETIQDPSAMVEKHIGVKSVCEAAAILATGHGSLVVPKQNTKNVTVSIARVGFTS